MKIEKQHIDQIKKDFMKMESRNDLLGVLNYSKPLLYGENSKNFKLKQLTYYSNPRLTKKVYKEFKIKKKSGADRKILAPNNGLKAIQKTLSFVLQCVFEPHKAAMGFVREKSIVDNAKVHVGNNYIYNIDLKDFFSSIDQARVWSCLKLKPFNLVDTEIGAEESLVKGHNAEIINKINTGVRKFITDHDEKIYYTIKNKFINFVIDRQGNYKRYKNRIDNSGKDFFEDVTKYLLTEENKRQLVKLIPNRKNLANIIASLCCTEIEVERKNEKGEWENVLRNVLPQGAPTSPMLSNVVCQRLDYILTGVAKRFNLRYTRYADDITFSSMHNVYAEEGNFLKELQRIITDQGFHIKESKTRLQKQGYRKEVTGLLVHEKVNVQKRYIKQLRMWLYLWERYGYTKAENIFKEDYFKDKGHIRKGKPNFSNVLSGKLEYLKMVKGPTDSTYVKLITRFEKLSQKGSLIENILLEWEEKGIESAMNKYKIKAS